MSVSFTTDARIGSSQRTSRAASPTRSLAGDQDEDKYVLVRKSLLPGGGKTVPVDTKSAVVKADLSTSVSKSTERTNDERPPVCKPTAALVTVHTQISQHLAAARSGLKPMSIIVPYSFTMNCAAGSGIISSTLPVLADSNANEWNALVALYDEYRISGATVRYFLPYTSPNITSSLSADSMFVLAYDPTDSSALTSVREGCELAQHALVCGSHLLTDAVAGTTRMAFLPSTGKPHTFKFSLNEVKAPTINVSGAINFSAGMWKSANGAGGNSPDGSLKAYGVSSSATTVVCVSGIVYLEVHFRSRK